MPRSLSSVRNRKSAHAHVHKNLCSIAFDVDGTVPFRTVRNEGHLLRLLTADTSPAICCHAIEPVPVLFDRTLYYRSTKQKDKSAAIVDTINCLQVENKNNLGAHIYGFIQENKCMLVLRTNKFHCIR